MTQEEALRALTVSDLKGQVRQLPAPKNAQSFLMALFIFVVENPTKVLGDDGILLVKVANGVLEGIAGVKERTIQRGKKFCREKGWVLGAGPGNKPLDYTLYLRRFCPPDLIEWIEWVLAHPDEHWLPNCRGDSKEVSPRQLEDCRGDSRPVSRPVSTCDMPSSHVRTCPSSERTGGTDGPLQAGENDRREASRIAIENQLFDQAYDSFFSTPNAWTFLKGQFGKRLFRLADPWVFERLFVGAVEQGWLPNQPAVFQRFLAYCHRLAVDEKVENPGGYLVSECKAWRVDRNRMCARAEHVVWAKAAAMELVAAGGSDCTR